MQRLAYTVWTADEAGPVPAWRELSLPANGMRKRRALQLYRTQTGLIADDPDGFHLTPTQIATMCGPFERFVRGR